MTTEPQGTAGGRWMFALPAGIGLIFVLLGTMLLGITQYEAALSARMRAWPSTPGIVVGSGLRDQQLQDGSWSQFAETGFSYKVNGHQYGFTTSAYAGLGRTGGNGHRLHYAVNDPVVIYYDPNDPSKGSLTNEREALPVVITVIEILLYILSLPFFYVSALWFVRRPRSTPAPTS